MIKWVERIEQIHLFRLILEWRQSNFRILEVQDISNHFKTTFLVAKTAPYICQHFDEIARLHKASNFKQCLKTFLQNTVFQAQRQRATLEELYLPFNTISIWTKVCLKLPDIQELNVEVEDDDAFYAHPNKNRFDTVLIDVSNSDNADNYEIKGMLSK